MNKPVVGFIGGRQHLQVNVWVMLELLFQEVRVQHLKKIKTLNDCGVETADTPSEIGTTLLMQLKSRHL